MEQEQSIRGLKREKDATILESQKLKKKYGQLKTLLKYIKYLKKLIL